MDQGDPNEQQHERHQAGEQLASPGTLALNLRELNREPLTRSAIVADWRKVEDSADLVEFSFSSEQPVERFFGMEVLSHERGAMNMDRLNSRSAPWLWNHDPGVVLGSVEKAWQGPDGRGYVRTRWSPNTTHEGSEEWKVRQNWEAGIVRTVSFMYSIDAPIDFQSREGVALVTAYTPMEVSTVSIPADFSVGQGRAIAPPDQAKAPAAATPTPSPIPMEDNTPNLEEVRAQAAAEERQRVAGITAMTREHSCEDLAQGLIERGASKAEATEAVLAEVGKRSKQPATPKASTSTQAQPIAGSADIGLTEREVSSYSFVRMINAAANPTDRAAQEAAAFEIEASRAAAALRGKETRGFMVPHDVLRRDLLAGTASAGGNTIGTDFRPGSFIELLRNQMVLDQVGITTLTGLTGPVAIPKQTGAATAYWVAEGGAPTESQQTIEQINMSPKTVAAFTDFSRRLMIQSSLDVEQFVRNDLSRVLALELDRVGLYGLGNTNQPLGIKATTGINTEDFAADAPTWAELVSMESKVADDNADVGSMAYITTPIRLGGMKTTEKASNTGMFIYEPGGTVNGYPIYRSKQVASNDVFFGVWSQLVLGLFSGLDIMVDPYTGSTSGTVRVVAMQDADYAVRYAESFTRGNNTL